MARSDPQKLAKALRANLRRRKSGAAAAPAREREKPSENAAEKPPEKPRPKQG